MCKGTPTWYQCQMGGREPCIKGAETELSGKQTCQSLHKLSARRVFDTAVSSYCLLLSYMATGSGNPEGPMQYSAMVPGALRWARVELAIEKEREIPREEKEHICIWNGEGLIIVDLASYSYCLRVFRDVGHSELFLYWVQVALGRATVFYLVIEMGVRALSSPLGWDLLSKIQ